MIKNTTMEWFIILHEIRLDQGLHLAMEDK